MDIITRQEALAQGLKKYFTGIPCSKGHISIMDVKEGCIECKDIRGKIYRQENAQKLSEATAKWKIENPDRARLKDIRYYNNNKEKMAEKSAKWRLENHEKAKQAYKTWRKQNPERAKALISAWNAQNVEARRIHKQNRRALIKKVGGRLSADIVSRLMRLQRGRCACCSKPLGEKFDVDHIMPISLGGPNIDSNVQLLRRKCNNEKKAKHPIDFMRERGMLL